MLDAITTWYLFCLLAFVVTWAWNFILCRPCSFSYTHNDAARRIVEWRTMKKVENMHIIIIITTTTIELHRDNKTTTKQQFHPFRRRRRILERRRLLRVEPSYVVAAAKDAVSSFSSCAWSVGGYGDGYRSDEINRKNVWRRINGNFRYNTGLL